MRGELFQDGVKVKNVQFYSAVTLNQDDQIIARRGMTFGPQDQMPDKILIGMEATDDLSAELYELRFRRSQNIAQCYAIRLEAPLSSLYKSQYYVPAHILDRLPNRSGAQPRQEIIVKKHKKNAGPQKRSLIPPSNTEE